MLAMPKEIIKVIGSVEHDLVEQFVTARVLAGNLEKKVAKHCRDVACATFKICEFLNLDPKTTVIAVVAGLVHDLGKSDIPPDLLEKPGKLTPMEMAVIKTHPETGYHRAIDGGINETIAKIALAHHENIDGTGYPRGVSGNAIPIEAKILAVADRFVAMTEKRVYRDPLPHKLVEQTVIDACKNGKLDREVCQACLAARADIRQAI